MRKGKKIKIYFTISFPINQLCADALWRDISACLAQAYGTKLHHPDAGPVLDARHAETVHPKGN